ncbi:uncharacterized protein LOC144593736 isoform X2 [Rhinoraja longicauda]
MDAAPFVPAAPRTMDQPRTLEPFQCKRNPGQFPSCQFNIEEERTLFPGPNLPGSSRPVERGLLQPTRSAAYTQPPQPRPHGAADPTGRAGKTEYGAKHGGTIDPTRQPGLTERGSRYQGTIDTTRSLGPIECGPWRQGDTNLTEYGPRHRKDADLFRPLTSFEYNHKSVVIAYPTGHLGQTQYGPRRQGNSDLLRPPGPNEYSPRSRGSEDLTKHQGQIECMLWHQGNAVLTKQLGATSQHLSRPQGQPPGWPDGTSRLSDRTGCIRPPNGAANSVLQPPGLTKSSRPVRRRGRRAGLLVRLKEHGCKSPLPSILQVNIQGIENQLDEFKARLAHKSALRDYSLLCLTETWLTPASLNCTIQPEGFSLHRMDRTASTGKVNGGGVCFLINSTWCSDVVVLETSCSPALEYLTVKCHPYYLLQEFTSVILIAVHIPPQADVKLALEGLHTVINSLETKYPKALLIIAGNFNQANLTSVLPNYNQHISWPTRGSDSLDHCYTTIKNAYRAVPRPNFGKSDHMAVFLLPAYKQK